MTTCTCICICSVLYIQYYYDTRVFVSMIKIHAPPSDQITPADIVGVVRC